MTVDNPDLEKKVLTESIDEILFDEEALNDIKDIITLIEKGEITALELKKEFVKFLLRIKDQLVGFVIYYKEMTSHNKIIDEITSKREHVNMAILKEMKEKDELLTMLSKELVIIESFLEQE